MSAEQKVPPRTGACLRPRIAMVNVWSDHNRGDAAIVHATCDAIIRRYPYAQIDLHNVVFGHTNTRKHVADHFASFVETPYKLFPALFPSMVVSAGVARVSQVARVAYLIRAMLILALASVAPRWGRILLRKGERPAYDSLTQSDCAVSKGGSYLLGNNWKSAIQLSMVMFPLVLAKICGVRTALLGVSVGPARSKLASLVMRFWFRWIDIFVLRENDACDTCARLGVPRTRMSVVPDLAFLLKIHESECPDEPAILTAAGRPRVAVTVRRWSFDDLKVAERQTQERNYLHGVAEALVAFHSVTKATVVLVPQVVGPGRQGSDLDALDVVERVLAGRVPVMRMPDNLDYLSLRAVYSNVDLLIGTRLHSVILAFGTPTVIIGYQGNKSIGTARLLGNEDGFIHINDVNRDALLDRIMHVWQSRAQRRENAQQVRSRFETLFAKVLNPVLDQLIQGAEYYPSQPREHELAAAGSGRNRL